MANKTAKEWLKRARDAGKRLKALEESKCRAYDRATAATMPLRRDFAGSAGNCTSDSKNDAYANLSVEVDKQKAEIDRICAEITHVIGQVDDNILATLLTEYYINGRSWKEVAAAINYDYGYMIRHLHPKALREIEQMIKRKSQITHSSVL